MKPIYSRTSTTLLALTASLIGCQTHSDSMSAVRDAVAIHDFRGAEAALDAKMGQVPGQPANYNVSSGNTPLFLLEKGMLRFAQGDFETAVNIFRECRDEFTRRRKSMNASNYFKGLNDDESLTYIGYDHEHMAIQTMLLLGEMLSGGGNVGPYASQIFARQQEMIDSPFGEDLVDESTGEPVHAAASEVAARDGAAAYFQGMVAESKRVMDQAGKAYQRAEQYTGGARVATQALTRANAGGDLEPGTGRLHVVYLGGRGPLIQNGTASSSNAALAITNVASAVGVLSGWEGAGTLGQKPIPVPRLVRSDPVVKPLRIRVDGGETVKTETLRDYYEATDGSLDALRPWVLARALARRAVKAGASAGASAVVASQSDLPFAGAITGLFANAALTATENADTRSWTSLPASLQVARVLVPTGEHELDLGEGMRTRVNVGPGEDTIVAVYRPNLAIPGQVLVDTNHALEPFVAVSAASGPPLPLAAVQLNSGGGSSSTGTSGHSAAASNEGGYDSSFAFYYGQKTLDNEVWTELEVDDLSVFGFEFTGAGPGDFGLEFGMNLQSGSGSTVDLLGLETYLGGRKNFGEAASFIQPYLSAGVTGTLLTIDVSDPVLGSDTLDDFAVGVYVGAGIAMRIGETSSFGLGYRAVTGTSVQPSGTSIQFVEEQDYDSSMLTFDLRFGS